MGQIFEAAPAALASWTSDDDDGTERREARATGTSLQRPRST